MASRASPIWKDPIAQLWHGSSLMPAPITNFEGINNVSSVLPPDTQGDVGPNHYVQWVNMSFAVYDRTGTKVYPAGPDFAAGNTLWAGFGGECENTNDGDPITLYDREAGRWLMTQFAVEGTYTQCLAISTTSDPTGTWYRYAFAGFGNKMNDYPKIWRVARRVLHDGQPVHWRRYLGRSGRGGLRARQDAGRAPDAGSVLRPRTRETRDLGGMLPSDLDGTTPPPAGSPDYFLQVDDNGLGYPADQLELFKFHVDWATPANSTFTGPAIINLTALGYGFDSSMCGGATELHPPARDHAGARCHRRIGLMYRLAYRNFGDHESLVFNHTVDVNGSDHAGIRWYELRSPNTTPTVFQAGTYAPDSDHRWMGSIAMDRPATWRSASRCRAAPRIHRSDMSAGWPAIPSARCRKAKPASLPVPDRNGTRPRAGATTA